MCDFAPRQDYDFDLALLILKISTAGLIMPSSRTSAPAEVASAAPGDHGITEAHPPGVGVGAGR